jgi:hypothetical protein
MIFSSESATMAKKRAMKQMNCIWRCHSCSAVTVMAVGTLDSLWLPKDLDDRVVT